MTKTDVVITKAFVIFSHPGELLSLEVLTDAERTSLGEASAPAIALAHQVIHEGLRERVQS